MSSLIDTSAKTVKARVYVTTVYEFETEVPKEFDSQRSADWIKESVGCGDTALSDDDSKGIWHVDVAIRSTAEQAESKEKE